MIEHHIFEYDSFVNNNKSIMAVQYEFCCHFNIHKNQAVPTCNTILCWVNALYTQGTLMNKRPLGASQTVHTPENVECVRQALLCSPSHSAWRHSSKLGLSSHLLRHILHLELHFQPYKLVVVQQLKPRDYAQQVTFAYEMQAIFEHNDNLILCMSDKAHFYLSGMVNQQNCHYWASENPKQLHERLLHSPKVFGALWAKLVYDKNVFSSDMCGFNRIGQWPTQLEHQRMLFTLSSLVTLFPGLVILIGLLILLTLIMLMVTTIRLCDQPMFVGVSFFSDPW